MTDPDYQWLIKTHLAAQTFQLREDLIGRVATLIESLIASKKMPYTLGVFGGWGMGKTTFLSQLAIQLDKQPVRVIYFNAWKYAGLADLLPCTEAFLRKRRKRPTEE